MNYIKGKIRNIIYMKENAEHREEVVLHFLQRLI